MNIKTRPRQVYYTQYMQYSFMYQKKMWGSETMWQELKPRRFIPQNQIQITRFGKLHEEAWGRELFTPPGHLTSRQEEKARPKGLLRVVYWASRIIGILPLKYDSKSESLKLSKFNMIYSILVMLTMLALWCYLCKEIHNNVVQEGNFLSGLEPIFLTFLNCTLMGIALSRNFHIRRIVSVLSQLEDDLSPRGPGPNTTPCFYALILTFATLIIDITASILDSTVDDTLIYIPYYWGAVGAVLAETQFTAGCLVLRYWFWILNERLKVVRRRAPGAALRLEGLRLSHGRMCMAASELETVFGPQLLFGCALCFLGTVLNSYFGVNGFYDVGIATQASDMLQETQWLWASVYLMRIFAMCFASTRLTIEAAQSGRLVHGLADSRLSPDMKEEILLFSMQISTSKLEFTAWGIITLDFSLLFAIVSSTTTYLLILIQYQPK